MDQQTNILKKTPGINNLFHSHVRRSRSLASLQKALAEDVRSHSALGSHRPAQDVMAQTGLRPPLKTAKTVNSPDGQGAMPRKWFANSSLTSTPQNSRTPSPPSRPKPAPRLWTEDDDEPDIKPSLLGLDSMMVPRSQYAPPNYQLPPRKPVGQMTVGSAPSKMGSPNPLYSQPRSHSPLTMKSSRSPDTSVSRRRKPSVADLNLDTLSTVTEWSHDSPTFRVARASRNHSDPATAAAKAAASRNESVTPRAKPVEQTIKFSNAESNSTAASLITPTATKRASSMLLPIALAPLITSSPPNIDRRFPQRDSTDEEKPPVPPKSPRYTKPSPNQRRPPPPKQRTNSSATSNASSVMHSANSSFSELSHAIASTATTLSPIELPSVWPDRGIEALASPPLSPKSIHALALPQIKPLSNTLPWVMKEFVPPQNKRKPQHGYSASEIIIPSPPAFESTTFIPIDSRTPPTSTPSGHQRNVSDSVLNRGRPTKRGVHKSQRSIDQEMNLAQIVGEAGELPAGHSRASATTALSREELADLIYDADRESNHFEVLAFGDVRNMKKELDLLEELVAQLRRKTLSLRESRRALHDRLIAYLKAPGNALVSREHVVKQDTELSELDAAIDEGTTKLEAVQERRNKVQRKLLEHTCAVLCLRTQNGPTSEQTPPQSPEEEEGEEEESTMRESGPDNLVIDLIEGDELEDASPGTSGTFEDLLDDYDRNTIYNPWHDSYGSGSARYRNGELDEKHWPANAAEDVTAARSDLDPAQIEREEREYIERMSRERAASEGIEEEEQAAAEKQRKELEQELQRQQKQRQADAAAKEEAAKAAKDAQADLPLLLSQDRYEPPSTKQNMLAPPPVPHQDHQHPPRTTSHSNQSSVTSITLPVPSPPQSSQPKTTEQAGQQQSPREELVQSIQIYADAGVYTSNKEGMESLLSSIEQEIDAIDRQRTMSVFV